MKPFNRIARRAKTPLILDSANTKSDVSPRRAGKSKARQTSVIRYAVVGLGHIAQVAVLPGFAQARNSQLTALVSDDPRKHRALGAKYKVKNLFSYDQYEECLHSGEIDAVYIALPNSMHREFAVRAAQAGIHVLCEKPLAVTESECEDIVRACAENRVQLMTAYRLHFERANLEVIKWIKAGEIGEPRIFNSVFTMQVREGNIRTQREMGGGTLYDIGIYCINAARYLFREEPIEGCAFSTTKTDVRFKEVDEMTSAILRFPEGRLAAFTSSFGASDEATYEVVGTTGKVTVENAYEYATELRVHLKTKTRDLRRTFPRSDQFGPELFYFSDCILKNRQPEPSGIEGLLDVQIIRSLYESAKTGQAVTLRELSRQRRPEPRQAIHRPPVKKPQLVGAKAGSRE